MTETIVETGVGLGAGDGAVAEAPFVPAVAPPVEPGGRWGKACIHADAEGKPELPFHLEVAGEIGLQQPDVVKERRAQKRPPVAEDEGDLRFPRPVLEMAAIGETDPERHLGALPRLTKQTLDVHASPQNPT
jgi:hypothetical protein